MKFLILAILCLAHSVFCAPSANNSLVRMLDNGEKQYYLYKLSVTVLFAYKHCKGEGLELLTVRSASEQHAVEEFLKNDPGISVWTSAIRLVGEENFTWLSTGQLVTYTNWSDGDPSTEVGTEACMEILSYDRTWHDQDCNIPQYFVCESE